MSFVSNIVSYYQNRNIIDTDHVGGKGCIIIGSWIREGSYRLLITIYLLLPWYGNDNTIVSFTWVRTEIKKRLV